MMILDSGLLFCGPPCIRSSSYRSSHLVRFTTICAKQKSYPVSQVT